MGIPLMIADDGTMFHTAGAYVKLNGRFLFVIGPTKTGDRLAVVRLGGHREGEESGWQCAAREVLEESGLQIEPMSPPATYAMHEPDMVLTQIAWEAQNGEPAAVFQKKAADGRTSLMYLATATGTPEPCMETRGLVLLTRDEVLRIASEPTTLAGLHTILRDGDSLPQDQLLKPFLQLQVLAELLQAHPDL